MHTLEFNIKDVWYDICMIDYINISEDESLHNNMMQFERTEIKQCKSQL